MREFKFRVARYEDGETVKVYDAMKQLTTLPNS